MGSTIALVDASSTTSMTSITSCSIENSSLDHHIFREMTTAIDVFPLGCVLYYLLTRGLHPFGYGAQMSINILEGKHKLSKLGKRCIFKGLIKDMIHHSPKHRPQIQEILTKSVFNVTSPK